MLVLVMALPYAGVLNMHCSSEVAQLCKMHITPLQQQLLTLHDGCKLFTACRPCMCC